MGKFIINGGNKLEGELQINGAKNAVLPIIAATVLNDGISYIHHCPKIQDVVTMVEILERIGCKVRWDDRTLIVDSTSINSYEIPEDLVSEMRSSIVLLGSVLGRMKRIRISYPGGCSIGPRPINYHLKALRQMGIEVKESHGNIECWTEKIKGSKIHLDFPSVGATENIILAAVLGEGVTTIYNPAKEPEVSDLQTFLNKMGAKVSGAGSNVICVQGVRTLHSVEHKIIPDRIVAGTYLAAAALTGGDILLHNVTPSHLCSVTAKLREAGCQIMEESDRVYLSAPERLRAVDIIRTLPHPGFPTDMQAQMMAILTVASGTSVISETVFESRYKHVDELIRMGADIKIEGHTAIITGVQRLMGTTVKANDLRGGAALIIAGLNAEGRTIVMDSMHIERGYEKIEDDLSQIGADIKRVDDIQ